LYTFHCGDSFLLSLVSFIDSIIQGQSPLCIRKYFTYRVLKEPQAIKDAGTAVGEKHYL